MVSVALDRVATLVAQPWSSSASGTRYLIPLDVGTPPQQTLVALSTAHAGLYLFDATRGACFPSAQCFNASASTSLERMHSIVSIDNAPVWSDVASIQLASTDARPINRVSLDLLTPTATLSNPSAFGAADGILGAADSAWATLLAPYGAAFALDLRPHDSGSASRLYLGPFNRSASAGLGGATRPVQWSYQQLRPPFGVEMFAPSVCGARLLGGSTAFWPATIDTSEACLVLPSNLFDGIFAWLAVATCTDADDGYGPRCVVPAAHVAQLPVLSFRLAQHSESLQLPLDALLLPPESAGGSRVLCIKRHPASTVDGLASYSYGDGPRESLMYDVGAATSPSESDDAAGGDHNSSSGGGDSGGGGDSSDSSSSSQAGGRSNIAEYGDPHMLPRIVLGTQVLQHFLVHVELRRGGSRTGLAPRVPPLPVAERAARRAASCAQMSQCVGQQRYVAARNECEQPDCSAFFQVLDGERGVCEWRGPFRVFVAVVVVFFGVAELSLQGLHVYIPNKFARMAAASA